MTKQLEVLRGFCLKPGVDVRVGDRIAVADIGQALADQLCSGSVPKCRPAPVAPSARAPEPASAPADGGPRAAPSTPEPRARVPGALRNR